MAKERVNFCVFGAGRIGKLHARNIAAHPRARMRRDIARVQRADAPGAEEAEVQHDRRRLTTMTESASADCRSRPLIFSA